MSISTTILAFTALIELFCAAFLLRGIWKYRREVDMVGSVAHMRAELELRKADKRYAKLSGKHYVS